MSYDGSITFDTHVDTGGFSSGASDINKEFETVRKGATSAADGVKQLPDAMNETADSTSRLSDIVKGGWVFKLIEKGVDAVVSSLDSAIDRYDTMNRFPMMLQQMGYSADEADAAVQRLSEGIQGLPTTLDSVVSTAQRLTILTGNLDGAVDTTLALNNAFLASGSSSDNAARGLEQYVQMLSKGEVDLESWRTLQETMGLALNKVAESFGYAGESAQNDLYAALQSGEVTFNQFNARLIQLNEGVGGFSDLAKTSSTGIKTAWTNMGTAIVRGTTTIIEAIDSGLSETRFSSVQTIIESLGKGIETAMKAAAPAIELVASHADVLVGVLGVLTTAYVANTAAAALNKAMHGGLGQVLGSVLILYGMLTTQGGALVVVEGLLTTVTATLSAAVHTLLGPVGLAVVVIGAVTAGAVALYKWITADSEAYTEQSEILDDLAEQQENLASSEESNAKAAQDNIKSIRASADASAELAKELGTLAGEENKTASQKKRMGELVDQLNEKYADLCLTYDEEADRLSMNTQQLQDYIEAQQTMDEAAALQERYNELLEEESTIRQNKAELEAKETEWADQLEQKLISQSEYNELIQQSAELLETYTAQEQELADKRAEIDVQQAALDTETAQTIIDNAQAAAEAEEQELQRRKDALQSYTEAATNMYDQISTKSDLSVQQMIENLQANQEAVATWADNLAVLGQRGLDQGLLQQLRDAGPESAATVAALVAATDEQLATLSETFRNGASVATDALLTELGLPEVTNAGSSMVDEIADGVDANVSLDTSTTQLIQDAKQAADSAVASSDFPSVGTEMINGIASGVAAGTSSLINAMRKAVQDAVAAAKAEAGIHSPSVLFRRVIGLNIMKGWALGMEDGAPLVSDEALRAMDMLRRQMAGSANPAYLVASMRDTVAGLQSGIIGQLHRASAAAWSRPAAVAAGNVSHYTQNVYFEQPMQAPDEIARELRIQNTYGLAGAR